MTEQERLPQDEFAFVEFRDTPEGRVAYMTGSRLTVYWVVKIAKGYDLDVDKTVAHWNGHHTQEWVQAALRYYEAFPSEIDAQIADTASKFDKFGNASNLDNEKATRQMATGEESSVTAGSLNTEAFYRRVERQRAISEQEGEALEEKA